MTAPAPDLVERVRAAGPAAIKLVVYRLSPDLLTFAPVSPGALANFPDVAVEEIDEPATIQSALAAVIASAPRPVEDFLDTRFGLVFSDAAGEPVLEVYKGPFVSRGQIDEQLCTYDQPALHEWLKGRYPR
jgi:hypothetical protein